jgi:hypothetical protein
VGEENRQQFSLRFKQASYQFHIITTQAGVNGAETSVLDNVVKLVLKFGYQVKNIALQGAQRNPRQFHFMGHGRHRGGSKIHRCDIKPMLSKEAGIVASAGSQHGYGP